MGWWIWFGVVVIVGWSMGQFVFSFFEARGRIRELLLELEGLERAHQETVRKLRDERAKWEQRIVELEQEYQRIGWSLAEREQELHDLKLMFDRCDSSSALFKRLKSQANYWRRKCARLQRGK